MKLDIFQPIKYKYDQLIITYKGFKNIGDGIVEWLNALRMNEQDFELFKMKIKYL